MLYDTKKGRGLEDAVTSWMFRLGKSKRILNFYEINVNALAEF